MAKVKKKSDKKNGFKTPIGDWEANGHFMTT